MFPPGIDCYDCLRSKKVLHPVNCAAQDCKEEICYHIYQHQIFYCTKHITTFFDNGDIITPFSNDYVALVRVIVKLVGFYEERDIESFSFDFICDKENEKVDVKEMRQILEDGFWCDRKNSRSIFEDESEAKGEYHCFLWFVDEYEESEEEAYETWIASFKLKIEEMY